MATGEDMATEMLCDVYFIGHMTYRCPGKGIEGISFCYRLSQDGGFEIYRNYAPYNEQKRHPGIE